MTAPDRTERGSGAGYAGRRGPVGVVWTAYRTTARHLAGMLVPAAIVLVPLSLAAVLAPGFLLGRDAAIVNHDLARVGDAAASGGWWLSGWLLLLAGLGLMVSLAACVVLAGGRLLGRSVPASASLTAALRRLPALAGLLVLAVLLLAPGLTAAWLGASLWFAGAVLVLVPLVGLPFATAVPAVLLEGYGLRRALGRAAEVTEYRRVAVATTLLVGMVLVPALATLAVELAIRPVGGWAGTLLEQFLATAAGVVTVPFAAATLAAVYLAPGPVPIEAQLPPAVATEAGAGRGLRRGGLLAAALALPGLLHVTYLGNNPLDLPVVTDRVLLTYADGYRGALPHLHHDAAGRVIALWAPDPPATWSAAALTCPDADCAGGWRRTGSGYGGGAARGESPWLDTAPMPDGSVAVAAWLPNPADRVDESDVAPLYQLRLGECRAAECGLPEPESAPVLADGFRSLGETAYYLAASVAAGQDGGVVVAHLRDTGEDRMDLGLTVCADLPCEDPETVVLARDVSPYGPTLQRTRPLDVAVAPDGTVLVALRTLDTGAVTLYSCEPPACRRPSETVVVEPQVAPEPGPHWTGFGEGRMAVELVVGQDGTPVLAYLDARDGVARLRVCRTRDCAGGSSDLALTTPGNSPPALALDRSGRPLVATYDQTALVLVRCLDPECAERETLRLVEVGYGPGHLDLALTPDGRPQILWTDSRVPPGWVSVLAEASIDLRLTTCAAADCR